MSRTFSSGTGRKPDTVCAVARQQYPTAVASPILEGTAGRLRCVELLWASNQTTPISSGPSSKIVPGAVLQLPESTIRKSPYSVANLILPVSSNATETSA
jgi:hypothetical protein